MLLTNPRSWTSVPKAAELVAKKIAENRRRAGPTRHTRKKRWTPPTNPPRPPSKKRRSGRTQHIPSDSADVQNGEEGPADGDPVGGEAFQGEVEAQDAQVEDEVETENSKVNEDVDDDDSEPEAPLKSTDVQVIRNQLIRCAVLTLGYPGAFLSDFSNASPQTLSQLSKSGFVTAELRASTTQQLTFSPIFPSSSRPHLRPLVQSVLDEYTVQGKVLADGSASDENWNQVLIGAGVYPEGGLEFLPSGSLVPGSSAADGWTSLVSDRIARAKADGLSGDELAKLCGSTEEAVVALQTEFDSVEDEGEDRIKARDVDVPIEDGAETYETSGRVWQGHGSYDRATFKAEIRKFVDVIALSPLFANTNLASHFENIDTDTHPLFTSTHTDENGVCFSWQTDMFDRFSILEELARDSDMLKSSTIEHRFVWRISVKIAGDRSVPFFTTVRASVKKMIFVLAQLVDIEVKFQPAGYVRRIDPPLDPRDRAEIIVSTPGWQGVEWLSRSSGRMNELISNADSACNEFLSHLVLLIERQLTRALAQSTSRSGICSFFSPSILNDLVPKRLQTRREDQASLAVVNDFYLTNLEICEQRFRVVELDSLDR